ncbi:MAG: ABC transporter permease [Bacillota bacterium]
MSNKSAVKEPLVKVSKNMDISTTKKIMLNVLAVVVAIGLSCIFLAALGYNPVSFFSYVIKGTFSNTTYLRLLIYNFIPLVIVSLGLTLAFRMKFWNIGAEGQFLMGAALSMTTALLIGDLFTGTLGIVAVLIMGAIGGGLFAVIPALFKIKFGTNETLFTLMLNYVAYYIIEYFLDVEFFSISGSFPTYKTVASGLRLTTIQLGSVTLDTSIIIAIVIFLFVALYMKYTKHGYEVNVVGDSPNTARYAGMKVKWITIRTIFISGAIIGLAAALKITGSSAGYTISTSMTGDVGWTGIIVSWLAKLNPIAVVFVAFMLSVLERGSEVARTYMGISSSISDVVQGIILFSVLAFDFFINYKVSFRKKTKIVAISDDVEDAEDAEENIVAAVESNDIATEEIVCEKEEVVVKAEPVAMPNPTYTLSEVKTVSAHSDRIANDDALKAYCDKYKFKTYKKSGGAK